MGYRPPEGPGTAAADIFSLGRVLYVVATGNRPLDCPELPSVVTDLAHPSIHFELNRIVCQACQSDPRQRYPSAAAMREDLLKLRGS